MKEYADRSRRETENLIFKERPVWKLMERYGTICDRRSSIDEYSKITITKFDENSSSSKYEPDSLI